MHRPPPPPQLLTPAQPTDHADPAHAMSRPPASPSTDSSDDPADTDPGAAVLAVLAGPMSQTPLAVPAGTAVAGVRQRLQARLAASLAAEAGLVTRRLAGLAAQPLAPGVQARCLYQAPDGRPLRPGEPLRAWLLDLAPGAALPAAALGHPTMTVAGNTQREWLLMSGTLCAESLGLSMGALDYHARPPGLASPDWTAPADGSGARVFYRECLLPGSAVIDGGAAATAGDAGALTVRDAEAGWPAYGPGIRRRVLWQHAGQAALLYRVDPGAQVPLHQHGHDEECLMVQGDVFLDDRLLRAGDYQLAPAGTRHHNTETDTGGVLFAHGDLDLQFIAG